MGGVGVRCVGLAAKSRPGERETGTVPASRHLRDGWIERHQRLGAGGGLHEVRDHLLAGVEEHPGSLSSESRKAACDGGDIQGLTPGRDGILPHILEQGDDTLGLHHAMGRDVEDHVVFRGAGRSHPALEGGVHLAQGRLLDEVVFARILRPRGGQHVMTRSDARVREQAFDRSERPNQRVLVSDEKSHHALCTRHRREPVRAAGRVEVGEAPAADDQGACDRPGLTFAAVDEGQMSTACFSRRLRRS